MGGEEFGRLPAAGGGRLHVLPELDRRLRVVAGARHIFEADAVGLRLGRARERELAHAGRHLHQRADRALAEAGRAERGLDSGRSEEHTSELQSLMRISYAVFCLKKKTTN